MTGQRSQSAMGEGGAGARRLQGRRRAGPGRAAPPDHRRGGDLGEPGRQGDPDDPRPDPLEEAGASPWNRPPPSTTSTSRPVRSSRRIAAPAMATISSTCRATSWAATSSPASASANTSGTSSSTRRWSIRSRNSASTRARAEAGRTSRGPAGSGWSRPASVLAAQGGAHRGHADVAAAAPVAGQLPDRREAHLAAVGRDPDAVHAGPDHHADPQVRPLPARRRRNVVVQQHLAGPAAAGDRRPQRWSSAGKSTPAGHQTPTAASGRSPAGRPASWQAATISASSVSMAAGTPRWWWDAPGPRAAPSTPPPASTRAVGLGVAPVDGQDRRALAGPGCHRCEKTFLTYSWWLNNSRRRSRGRGGHVGLKIAVVGGQQHPELVQGFAGRTACRSTSWSCSTSTPSAWEWSPAWPGACWRGPAGAAAWSRLAAEQAIDGADFVVVQLRVGGQAMRLVDETLPLEFGCVGQETTGRAASPRPCAPSRSCSSWPMRRCAVAPPAHGSSTSPTRSASSPRPCWTGAPGHRAVQLGHRVPAAAPPSWRWPRSGSSSGTSASTTSPGSVPSRWTGGPAAGAAGAARPRAGPRPGPAAGAAPGPRGRPRPTSVLLRHRRGARRAAAQPRAPSRWPRSSGACSGCTATPGSTPSPSCWSGAAGPSTARPRPP